MRHETNRFYLRLMVCALLPSSLLVAEPCFGQLMEMRTETFNSDPGWDGHNNRIALQNTPISITNNFGFKNSSNAGGSAGEIGGSITPAGEPAYYAKPITSKNFNDTLTASGKLKVTGKGNSLLGFFNSGTVNEWRTPSSLALRLNGRGDGTFLAYFEYATDQWRAGSSSAFSFNVNQTYDWSLTYNPSGNGSITGFIGSQTLNVNLDTGHKADGATFNRFGFLNVIKSYDDPGEVYVDDLNINGVMHNFNTDPGATFEGLRNNTTYSSRNKRPWFNFGYSSTNHAQGAASGEIGGEMFRGDNRFPEAMAFYGDELNETLTLDQPLSASGKVAMRRGVTDSTTLIGFFHSADSIQNSTSQQSGIPENFVGATIEGPSREGFFFYPSYGINSEGQGVAGPAPPYIYPNGDSHDWTLDYNPAANGGQGQIIVSLDGQTATLNLKPGDKQTGAHFDRFGIITTHIDGNGQTVYFDDLTYSVGIQQQIENQIEWTADVSGDAASPTNWFPATAPNSNELNVVLGSVIRQPRVVFADSDMTMKALRFDNANSYVLAGNGSANFEADSGLAKIDVDEGNHEFRVKVNLLSDLDVIVANGSTLTFNNGLDLNGHILRNLGQGDLVINNSLTLDGGTIQGPVLGSAISIPEPKSLSLVGLALLGGIPTLRRSRPNQMCAH